MPLGRFAPPRFAATYALTHPAFWPLPRDRCLLKYRLSLETGLCALKCGGVRALRLTAETTHCASGSPTVSGSFAPVFRGHLRTHPPRFLGTSKGPLPVLTSHVTVDGVCAPEMREGGWDKMKGAKRPR